MNLMKHEGTYRVVRMHPPGTTLSAINDDGDNVTGKIELYRFAEYTRSDGTTSHDVEYRVRWSDGLLEWIPWREANLFSPVRPQRPHPDRNTVPRSYKGSEEQVLISRS